MKEEIGQYPKMGIDLQMPSVSKYDQRYMCRELDQNCVPHVYEDRYTHFFECDLSLARTSQFQTNLLIPKHDRPTLFLKDYMNLSFPIAFTI